MRLVEDSTTYCAPVIPLTQIRKVRFFRFRGFMGFRWLVGFPFCQEIEEEGKKALGPQ